MRPLFFNEYNVSKEAKGDIVKYLVLLRNYYYGKIAKKFSDIPKLNLSGNSFILNPGPVLNEKTQIDSVFLVQYIKLASYRNYLFYKEFNIKTLDLNLYPDLDLSIIKYNPILIIDNKQLKFKYE